MTDLERVQHISQQIKARLTEYRDENYADLEEQMVRFQQLETLLQEEFDAEEEEKEEESNDVIM